MPPPAGTAWEDVFTRQDLQVAPALLEAMGIDAYVVGNHGAVLER